MDFSSNNPGPQQDQRQPLSLSLSADVSANDRLARVQLKPPFPAVDPYPKQATPACEPPPWDNESTHNRGADSTPSAFTGSEPLLLPPRGWSGTEVTVYLPSSVWRDTADNVELAFRRSRVTPHLDIFTDPTSNHDIVRLTAYAPPVPCASSSSSNQHDTSRPLLPLSMDEEYTVQVILYWDQSTYAVGTFTYLPTTLAITIPRHITPPHPPPTWSLHSSPYKGLVRYSCHTPSLLRQHHGSFITNSTSMVDDGYPLEMPTTAPESCLFPSQYGMYNGALPNPSLRVQPLVAVGHNVAAVDTTEPPVEAAAASRHKWPPTRKLAKRAPATHRSRSSSNTLLAANTSIGLYHPYPNTIHHVEFTLLGDTGRLVDDWSNKEVTQGRRVVRFWREDEDPRQDKPNDDDARSTAVQCAFEVIKDIHQHVDSHSHERPPALPLPGSMLVSCIRWNDEYYVTSVDLIGLLEMLVNTRFNVAGKNRIRRNLEGFHPVTASKYNANTLPLYQLIMGFTAPKPRNIEKDIKVFYWRILPYALKKLVVKHYAPPASEGPVRAQHVPRSPRLISPATITTTTTTTTDTWAEARRDEEVHRLLRHRDPASPETPPDTPITPNDGQSFVYERFDD